MKALIICARAYIDDKMIKLTHVNASLLERMTSGWLVAIISSGLRNFPSKPTILEAILLSLTNSPTVQSCDAAIRSSVSFLSTT